MKTLWEYCNSINFIKGTCTYLRRIGHLGDSAIYRWLRNTILSICFIDIHGHVSSREQLLLKDTHYGKLDIEVYNGKQFLCDQKMHAIKLSVKCANLSIYVDVNLLQDSLL